MNQSIERTIDLDIGPTCAKGLQRKDESSLKLIKNLRRTDYRDAKLTFICAW